MFLGIVDLFCLANILWLLSFLFVVCYMIWIHYFPLIWSFWAHCIYHLLPSSLWVISSWVCLFWGPIFCVPSCLVLFCVLATAMTSTATLAAWAIACPIASIIFVCSIAIFCIFIFLLLYAILTYVCLFLTLLLILYSVSCLSDDNTSWFIFIAIMWIHVNLL